MKKVAVIVLAMALLMVGVMSISTAYATKPITMTLSGNLVILGAGTGTEFPAGKSDNYQIKFRDVPFVLTGDIMAGNLITLTPGGLYHANLLSKLSGDVTWHGTWTMEAATIDGIGSGSLEFGSLWDEGESAAEWWITGATGDLSSLRGRGTCTTITYPYLYAYEFEVQINP